MLIATFTDVFAQKTVVTGRVSDAATMEPLAFANVFFKGTNTGTTTNFEGFFELTTGQSVDSIVVSFIGYEPETVPVVIDSVQVINFQLFPAMTYLKRVVIVPGENPAHRIIRNVWSSKDEINPDRLNAWDQDNYTRTQVYLRRFFDRSYDKDTFSEGLFNSFAITSNENSVPALPVFLGETWSTLHFLRFPQREKVVIRATRTNSLADVETALVVQLIQKSTRYNFHNNHVRILDRNFVSPTSTAGMFYYRYYLIDSLYIDNMYCYEIKVVPKRDEDLVFNGTIWIHDTTFALKRISVEVGRGANLNFVQRIKIQQDLSPSSGGIWYPVKTRILADAVNIFISSTILSDSFTEGVNHPPGFYNTELEYADNLITDDSEFAMLRSYNTDGIDSLTDQNITMLKSSAKAKVLAAIVSMSVKGYLNLGKVEVGPYLLLFSTNEVEGHRFRLGYRTTPSLSDLWLSKGFLAYGTLDKKVKYNIQIERFLSKRYWSRAGVQYSQDVENLGALDEFYNPDAFLSFASSFGGSDKLNSIRLGRLWFETDIFRGFTQKVVFRYKSYMPVSPDYHFAWYGNAAKTDINTIIRVSEITFTSLYQPKATFIVDKHERFPVAIRKSPAFTLNYTIGIKGMLKSDFSYHIASLSVKQSIIPGSFGVIFYNLSVSKCFSQLPYPLLTVFPGNESFFRSDRLFNLMSYGEFIADQSATLFVSYRQDGFILDKIPLIKKLKLRTVATTHIAYGSFDHGKNGIYNEVTNPAGIIAPYDKSGVTVTRFKTLNPGKPYIEVSYGIENIFRIFRLDAIHRLTYLSPEEPFGKPRKFGIKISAAFRF